MKVRKKVVTYQNTGDSRPWQVSIVIKLNII